MQSTPQITMKELATALKKDEKTILRNINKLKEKGIVERVGSDKTGYWKVNNLN